MLYRILADLVVFLHFLWILFLIFGIFLGIRYRLIRIAHISGLAFAVIIQVFGWYCPLTDLEVWLRSKYDPNLFYTGSFIVHYIEKIVYVDVSRGLIFVSSVLLCGINAWFYLRKKKR